MIRRLRAFFDYWFRPIPVDPQAFCWRCGYGCPLEEPCLRCAWGYAPDPEWEVFRRIYYGEGG